MSRKTGPRNLLPDAGGGKWPRHSTTPFCFTSDLGRSVFTPPVCRAHGGRTEKRPSLPKKNTDECAEHTSLPSFYLPYLSYGVDANGFAHSRQAKLKPAGVSNGLTTSRTSGAYTPPRELLRVVSDSAVHARLALEELTLYRFPRYSRCRAIVYGSFIDWAILLRVPLGDNVFGSIARHRGPEQIRLLLALALFDVDGDGEIDETELEKFDQSAEEIIADGKQMCVNLSLVSVMLVGLLHNVTVGRPVPFAFGEGAKEQYGSWLLWIVYGLNLCGEAGAFFTMCLAIITRNCLTNVLPTRQHKVDFLRTTNALGFMGSTMLISLWCFMLSSIAHALTTNPTLGLLGASLLTLLLLAFMFYIAPLRYRAAKLLHEEVVHTLKKREEKRKSRRSSSYISSRAGSVPPSPARPPPSHGPSRAAVLPSGFQQGLLAAGRASNCNGRSSSQASPLVPLGAPNWGIRAVTPSWTALPATLPSRFQEDPASLGESDSELTELQDPNTDVQVVIM